VGCVFIFCGIYESSVVVPVKPKVKKERDLYGRHNQRNKLKKEERERERVCVCLWVFPNLKRGDMSMYIPTTLFLASSSCLGRSQRCLSFSLSLSLYF
jgi:hypothetical protein